MSEELSIPFDDGALSALWDPAAEACAVLVLAHGSGAGKAHPLLTGFTRALVELGVGVLRFNFPYMDAGRKFPDRAPQAVSAWNAAYQWTLEHRAAGLPVFAAGKSFGGRMASLMAAEGRQVPGLVFLGYPLHAPKTPQKLRDEHLYGIESPMLFLQGTRDPFAQPELLGQVIERLGDRAHLHRIEGGDHSFKTARSGRSVQQDGAQLAPATADFITGALQG